MFKWDDESEDDDLGEEQNQDDNMDDIDEEAMGFLDLLGDDENDNKSDLPVNDVDHITNASQFDDSKSDNIIVQKHDSSSVSVAPSYDKKATKLKVLDIDDDKSKQRVNESKSVTSMSDVDINDDKSERS